MKSPSFLTWILIAVVGYVLFSSLGAGTQTKYETMTYSELMQTIEQQPASISQISIANGSNEITVERKDKKPAHVTLPAQAGQQSLLDAANKQHVKVAASESSGLLSALLGFLPTLLFIGLIWYFMRGMGGGGGGALNLTNSEIIVQMPGKPGSKTFADVAGCKEAKEELAEIIEYLKDPSSFHAIGATLPKGVLLIGPPGNGKTLLAKAIAGEAGVPFLTISGSGFVELFVGQGARKARTLFDEARKNQPCILFIDEIDAVGRARGSGGVGGNDEREQTLNEILVQMDGFKENESVILIAATNRPDILDPAITRSGRFDLHVNVDAPDMEGREAIFRIHMQGRPVDASVDAAALARITPGFSGADIASACNEAARIARRRMGGATKRSSLLGLRRASPEAGTQTILMKDFSEGIDRVMMGPARDRAMSEDQRRNTAVHEVGHAGVGHALKGAPIRKITIVSRSKALGFTLSYPEGDQYNKTRDEMLSEIASMMGGRVAQQEILGCVDTGASNDFEQATKVARAMVTKFGMSKLGHVFISDESTMGGLGRAGGGGFSSASWGPSVLDNVDVEVQAILNEATERARTVIAQHRASFDRVVECLLRKETILGDEFLMLWNEPTHECNCEDEDNDPVAHEGAALTDSQEPAAPASDVAGDKPADAAATDKPADGAATTGGAEGGESTAAPSDAGKTGGVEKQ
jgi:cell division protease FtsH